MASKLTKVVANFETSLATKLANGATSGALTSITDKNSVALPAGKYCMIIDRGTGDEEHLLFDLSGTAMSNIFSVSRQGVQTAGVQNLNGHRAGSKCYLTDFVNLKVIVDILNGADSLDSANPVKYDADPTFNDSKQVVSKGYVDVNLAGKASTNGNNTFTGNNNFINSPNVPNAVSASQPVTLSQLMAAALTGIQAGLEYVDIALNADGSVRSLHDNVNGKTIVFEYDDNRLLRSIYDGVKKWSVRAVDERIASIIH
ncbi:MAG: hypothetical protein KBD47_00255 [Candidatus Pacebacteria bacterium]|nr:hypothetical protein [Candidatus Paceibacterota bacterium]